MKKNHIIQEVWAKEQRAESYFSPPPNPSQIVREKIQSARQKICEKVMFEKIRYLSQKRRKTE
jgi:hypothetical protein